jgi:hypothetical protein
MDMLDKETRSLRRNIANVSTLWTHRGGCLTALYLTIDASETLLPFFCILSVEGWARSRKYDSIFEIPGTEPKELM